MEQRIRLVIEQNLQELTMAELSRKYNISRKTGYKWLSRAKAEGLESLVDRSLAPHTHPNQVSDDSKQAVLAMRAAHPTWGPKKLLRRLEHQGSQTPWPARSTVTEILRRNGLVVNRKRRRRVPPYEKLSCACGDPNDIWCVDFKGWFKTQAGSRCDPPTMTDAHSR